MRWSKLGPWQVTEQEKALLEILTTQTLTKPGDITHLIQCIIQMNYVFIFAGLHHKLVYCASLGEPQLTAPLVESEEAKTAWRDFLSSDKSRQTKKTNNYRCLAHIAEEDTKTNGDVLQAADDYGFRLLSKKKNAPYFQQFFTCQNETVEALRSQDKWAIFYSSFPGRFQVVALQWFLLVCEGKELSAIKTLPGTPDTTLSKWDELLSKQEAMEAEWSKSFPAAAALMSPTA